MSRHRFSLLSLFLLLAGSLPLSAQQFGGSLAVSGDHVLVGETQNLTLPGIVYVFGADGGAWQEVTRLMVSGDAGLPDGFGRALAADERTMLAGASVLGDGAGAVYVLRDASGAWTQNAVLTPTEPTDSAAFGSGVVLSEDIALRPAAAGYT